MRIVDKIKKGLQYKGKSETETLVGKLYEENEPSYKAEILKKDVREKRKQEKVYIIRREAIFGDPVKWNLINRRKYKGHIVLK